jgi:hypothetical protein
MRTEHTKYALSMMNREHSREKERERERARPRKREQYECKRTFRYMYSTMRH